MMSRKASPLLSAVASRPDYIVDFISDETIIEAASRWREEGVPSAAGSFDITIFVTDFLQRHSSRPLKVDLSEHKDHEDLAFVSYDPQPVLHSDVQLWQEAKLGEPRARYILAHECCHTIFHSNNAKAFSDPLGESYIKSVIDQRRPEHHANLFADYFLVPDRFVKEFKRPEEIALRCDVEKSVAERRIEQFSKKYLRSLLSTGEYCPQCAEPLFRRGIDVFCKGKGCFYAVSV